jgi:hypothetical protein
MPGNASGKRPPGLIYHQRAQSNDFWLRVATRTSFLTKRELRGNLFVGIPFGDQPQYTHFCRGQRVIGGMLGKLVGSLGGKRLFPACTARIVSRSSLCKLFFSR